MHQFHAELAAGRWFTLSIFDQMGNIGSEVGRAAKWQGKDEKMFWGSVTRALELFDLTLRDPRWAGARAQEIARAKEVFCDGVLGGKEYGTNLIRLDEIYFLPFALAARQQVMMKR